MPIDPRSRKGAGTDGRQYVRKTAMYIDVLGLPNMREAVLAAQEMLRHGIARAMTCNIEDPSVHLKKETPKSQVLTQSSHQPQRGSNVSRDPVSVYSAIAKRVRKPPVDPTDSSKKQDPTTPVVMVDDDDDEALSKSEDALRSWNSAKKAGPSILTKRARPQSSDPTASSAPERVFQPASKRERKAEVASKQMSRTSRTSQAKESDAAKLAAYREIAKSVEATPARSSADSRAKSLATVSLLPGSELNRRPDLSKLVGKVERKLVVAKPVSRAEKKLVRNAAVSSSAKQSILKFEVSKRDQKSGITGASVESTKNTNASSVKKHEAGASSCRSASTTRVIAGSDAVRQSSELPVVRAPGIMKRAIQKQIVSNNQRSPGIRKLPPSWSRVTSKDSKDEGNRGPALKQFSLQRSAAGSATARKVPALARQAPGANRLQQASVTQIQGRLFLPPKTSQTPSDAEIPVPSVGELMVKQVPGSQTINGVRPNGYTISKEGVVKPVVTFSPKPKLPHKLRQTSVEKLFEGLRFVKKQAEAIALQNALQTEQEVYAASKSRVDYRAAITVKLKDIRK